MDPVRPEPASNVSGLVRTFTKVLKLRVSGIAPEDRIGKVRMKTSIEDEVKVRIRASMEALLAKLFASISSVKAAYAQLQIFQSPYDAEGIQSSDEILVNELKHLSELKQIFLKKQIDPSPQVTILLAEIQEQQGLLKTYEIMRRKFESQVKVKDSDINFLKEKLEESDRLNRSLEKKLKSSGPPFVSDDLHFSGLNPNHFITVLRQTVKSIRSFVKLMISEMRSSGWDMNAAANSIEPDVVYARSNHVCFAFESFVCRKMFDGFQYSDFSPPNHQQKNQKRCHQFFDEFRELKSMNQNELLYKNREFGKFCREKYLLLVHPKMELSFFGDLNQRNVVNTGGYPETGFFTGFVEMAKRVWVLHCLAFSFEPEAKIFQMRKGCRFSDVYMESVAEDAFFSENGTLIVDPRVGFTVVPGFKIGKTVIQCQVYPCPG
ncbi:protein of unknown function DUF641 [Macleaya cordata]|uniref:Uncharacterized protein n=1 Tax=Macleaya cordata TaxID=56857 RepID=A0A200QR77_MACCD|nr:protein of unknown function DUF641 [Macleaya cordata]